MTGTGNEGNQPYSCSAVGGTSTASPPASCTAQGCSAAECCDVSNGGRLSRKHCTLLCSWLTANTTCGERQYFNGSNCANCPPNSLALPGATDTSDCLCDPGYESSGSGCSSKCELGYVTRSPKSRCSMWRQQLQCWRLHALHQLSDVSHSSSRLHQPLRMCVSKQYCFQQ